MEIELEPRRVHVNAIVLGGVLTALAFPLQPNPMLPAVALWPLIFIGPAPFLARLLTAQSYRAAIRAGCAFGIPWIVVMGVWVFRVFDTFGWVIVWLPIIATLMFAISAHATRRARFAPAWSWPLLWIGIEFMRSEWTFLRIDWLSDTLDPLNFSWFALGHPRLISPLFAQTADIGGGYFLTLAPLLTSLTLAWLWTFRVVPVRLALATVLLFAAEIGYGAWRLNEPVTGPSITAGVVQTERFQLPVLMDLTARLLSQEPEVQLVVWPEESFTGNSATREALLRFAQEHHVALATGVEALADDGTHRNLVWWLPAKGEAGEYAKRLRVPFVERHPASSACPTFDCNGIRVGILICYDMDFAWNPRQAAAAGAQVFLMSTLDEVSWGGTEHAQHSLLPRLRAIENRRPIVQAATSGVSQIINDRGQVLAEIPYRLNRRPDRPTVFLEGFTAASIHAGTTNSPYSRGGWLAGPITTILAAFVFVAALVRGRKP